MAWLKGCLSHLNPFADTPRPPQFIAANPGPYDQGVSPNPFEPAGNLFFSHEGGMSEHNDFYPMLAPPESGHRQNPPPLLVEGSAQRDHPTQLAAAPFTPIGSGVPAEQQWVFCAGAGALYDMQTWAQGLGQIANQIGLVYSAANLKGTGAVQGAGITQIPFEIPGEFAMSYVSTDGSPLTVPNASGLPFIDLLPSDLNSGY